MPPRCRCILHLSVDKEINACYLRSGGRWRYRATCSSTWLWEVVAKPRPLCSTCFFRRRLDGAAYRQEVTSGDGKHLIYLIVTLSCHVIGSAGGERMA